MSKPMPENKKVLLGLSGGVDSTAAALLLKERGYDVTGLFFDVLGTQAAERKAAQQAAEELSISFLYRNVAQEFKEHIITYFCESYMQGETPNPCTLCNPTVKFRVMKEAADEIGAYYLATGHYAQVEFDQELKRWIIRRASSKKDQSYMMYRLDQSVLSRLILPLGEIEEKSDTRRLVRDKGIYNADKKDSQEICFIREGTYIDFLEEQGYSGNAGDFIDQEGRVLGRHQGLPRYTVGQRKGLGVTFGKPMFVTALESLKNQVILGENKDLFNSVVHAKNIRLVCYDDGIGPVPEEWEGKKVQAKIRYAAVPEEAVLYRWGNHGFRLVFVKPQRAATPGQSVVIYENDRLLGGGFITKKRETESAPDGE